MAVMTDDPPAVVDPALHFWAPIRANWEKRGCLPSVPDLSRATGPIEKHANKERGTPGDKSYYVPPTTIYQWLRYKPTFPQDWKQVAALLKALGESPDDWKAHYEKSNSLRANPSSVSSSCQSARSPDSCVEAFSIDSPDATPCQIRSAAEPPPVPPLELPADAIATMIVVLPHAGVYRSPGDTEFLAVKARGARITMPIEVPPFEGPDGRCYRMVRTPTRTSTGYAYMLNEALGTLIE
jgi:hypothetical protein